MAWSGTPQQAAAAIPMMAADGVTPVNSAANYRQGFLGALLTRAPGSNGQVWRSGVLVSAQSATPAVPSDLLITPTNGTPDANVRVAPGTAIFYRAGLAGGPYAGTWTTNVTLPIDPGSSTNPRIDTIYAFLTDAALGDTGTQGAAIGVLNGTPTTGATLSNLTGAATLPVNTVLLGYVLQPISSTTVTAANVMPFRASTSLLGSVRPLLEGEVNFNGAYYGEFAFDNITSFKRGLCWWDGVLWHGTQRKTYNGNNVWASGFALNWGGGAIPTYNLCQVFVPDPGYPYYIQASASACGFPSAGGPTVHHIRLDNFTSGPVICSQQSSFTGTAWAVTNPAGNSNLLTGGHWVMYSFTWWGGTSGSLTTTAFGAGITLTVDVVPA